jgi:3-deoxy-D-manno-octulosonate 8-phosphate phosphatase (KDO 8-P phosphatase)
MDKNKTDLYPHVHSTVWQRAQKIRCLICDVDGVLTDGRIYLSAHQEEIKAFHAHDGYGLRALLNANIEVAIISGRSSAAVQNRMESLGVHHVYQGYADKMMAFDMLAKERHLSLEECAFIGDDIVDLTLLDACHLSIAVPEAVPMIKQRVHHITKARAGMGAVREICDVLLISQGHDYSSKGLSM